MALDIIECELSGIGGAIAREHAQLLCPHHYGKSSAGLDSMP